MAGARAEAARRNFETERTIAIVGAVLMLGKFFAYFVTGSVSILTDALESIVNVVAGAIGVYALWLCMRPVDRDHPYGRGKMELISSGVEGVMIFVAGILIIIESVQRLLDPADVRQLDVGLIIVIVAAIVNFAMGWNAVRRGRAVGSLALEASGKHLCSDTYSSIGIIAGLGLMYIAGFMGYDAWWLDPVTAILFGAFIIYTGLGVIRKATGSIIDSADRQILTEVTRAINHVRTDEIIDVHHLRVVRYGPIIHVEFHMIVPESTIQKRVDELRYMLSSEIEKAIGDESDITIQTESCDYLSCHFCGSECEHRDGKFRGNVILDLETVTSVEPPSQQQWPLKNRRPDHSSVRKPRRRCGGEQGL